MTDDEVMGEARAWSALLGQDKVDVELCKVPGTTVPGTDRPAQLRLRFGRPAQLAFASELRDDEIRLSIGHEMIHLALSRADIAISMTLHPAVSKQVLESPGYIEQCEAQVQTLHEAFDKLRTPGQPPWACPQRATCPTT